MAYSLCFEDRKNWNTNDPGGNAKAKLHVETCKMPPSAILNLAFW